MNGASLIGVVNADARSDQEIRANVRRFFGGFLALVFLMDIGSAMAVVWMSCGTTESSAGEPGAPSAFAVFGSEFAERRTTATFSSPATREEQLRCSVRSIGFSEAFRNVFGHHNHDHDHHTDDGHSDDADNMGDFVVLSLIRCATTLILLWAGVRFGRKKKVERRRPTNTTRNNNTNSDALTEPLLSAGHPDGASDAPCSDSSRNNDDETTETAGLATSASTASSSSSTPTTPTATTTAKWWSPILQRLPGGRPETIRALVLFLIFASCTVYQLFAGLRVATMEHGHHGFGETLGIVLLCGSVLWINAEAYIVRVLVIELTRVEDNLLFLPPEIHRHPLYLETDSRSMTAHWCDLCSQRIVPRTTVSTTRCVPVNGNSNSNINSNTTVGHCYRCSLCDFDICLKCSSRNDAAVVGEGVLRGDRGVRTQTPLTTSEYVKRSIAVAGRSEWPWLMASFALLALSSLSRLFLPQFQGKIIDKVIPIPYHGNDDDDDGGGDAYYDKAGFVHYILIYVVLMIVQGAVSTLYSAIFTLVSRRLKFTIRNALLEKILAQDVAYFDGTESGNLISRLTNDLDMMMSPIQSSLSSLLSNCLVLIGGLVMCFAKSYRLSMLAFVTIGPISYLWDQYAQWSRGLAREMLSHWAHGNSIASQALSNIRTVKAFGCENVVLNNYSATNQMALDCGIKDAWGNGITQALTGYLDLGTGVMILYFGGLLVYRGEMTVGDLVTYQLFWNMMNNSYQNLQNLVTSFTRSAAGAEKVFSLWDSDPDIDPSKGSDINADEVEGHLQLKNVSFYYQMRPDNMVLHGFDLDIPAGKTTALVGRSGGGKSTIINLLLRFYDPREGSLLLDGKPYESLRVHQLRHLFGVVTQDTELFALTVEENIAYGLVKGEDYTTEDVIDAAKKAYAHEFITDMKDGYQTRIGERGGRISGGQRQRLAIARVFLRKPRIILLDEATSALDENSQEAVQKALADLVAESRATVVMVAHRLSTVVNADTICVIDKGRVLERGTHEELAEKPGGIYATMVSKQREKQSDMLDQEQQQQESRKGRGETESRASDTIDDLLANDK